MTPDPTRSPRRMLAAILLGQALLYLAWFHDDRNALAAMLVFVLPLLLLLVGTLTGRGRAPFWAGVLGLFLFCHAVMTAWADPAQRGLALCGVVLSVLAVFASSWDGLRARFGARR